MTTYSFSNVYFDISGTADSTTVFTGGPYSFTTSAPLYPGDSVTISGAGGSADFTYEGYDQNGDPVFFQNVTWLFSNNAGLNGTAFPSTLDTTDPFCFLEGTLIATPEGEIPVEALCIGDLILTADGRSVPVRWLGIQTINSPFGLPIRRTPVRIAAGSLGENLPRRDLRVTSDHALLLDGVLAQAGALVNNTSITHMTNQELGCRFAVFHIETEAHDIIIAEGVAVETFIDNVSRTGFDNYAVFESLYGAPAEIAELGYLRAKSWRQLPPSIRARIESTPASQLAA